jgi:hypothetical protein
VVNIHTNGPIVYAHEIYTLRQATPGAYTVTLTLYPTSLDCSGTTIPIQAATLTTNPQGNGQADAKFTPEQADGLRGSTLSARWSVSGPASYVSDCMVITLD